MKISCIIPILFLSLFSSAREYTFERITSNDGLSQNNVLSIYQCSDGYMWFATYNGLNRYDGYDFKVYQNSVDDTNSISSNLLSYITEDNQKNLWIGTFNDGVCRFNKETEKFTTIKNTAENPNLITGNRIINILCDSKGNIWLATLGGISHLKMENNEIQKITNLTKTYNPESLSSNHCRMVFEDSKGRILVASKGGLDLLLDNDGEEIENKFQLLITHKNFGDVTHVGEISEGYLFSHFTGVALLKFDPKHPENTQKIRLEKHFSRQFKTDSKGMLWSAGDQGIYRFERTGDENMPYKLAEHFVDGDTEESLSHKVIRSLVFDNTGILWIGTNGLGIMKCNTTKSKFRHYKKTKQNGSLSANKVWSIFEDPQRNLWFSTEGGGLNFLSASKNKNYKTGFIEYTVNKAGQQNFAYQIMDFTLSEIPQYLAGVGYLNEIVTVSYIENEWQVQPAPFEVSRQIMALCKDEYDAAWLASYNGGLYRWAPNGSKPGLSNFIPDNSAIPSKIIRNVFEDSKGRLWIGTNEGLAILTREEKNKEHPNFVVIRNIPGDSTSLSHKYTVPIMETLNGEIWIGTFGGALNQYIEGSTETNGSFSRLGTEDGLPNNTIKQIIEDDLGNLWVSSNKGISRIDSSRTKIRNFDLSDGLQDLEFTDLSGTKLADGEIIFGGVNGFNAFYPYEIFEDTNMPALVFTDLEIMNTHAGINEPIDGDIILEKAINITDAITLKHFQNSFTIFFSAIHYAVPEGNHYKYMLEGFDDKWITTSYKSRFARYTNIEAGTYTFKLLASNSHGVWAKKPKTISIIVKPPFWFTWWFIAIVLLLIAGSILLVIYWRTHRIRLRNLELEREVELRTMEITEKNSTLLQQAKELSKSNVALEQRQQKIEELAEELMAQKDELLMQRDELKEVNAVKDKLFSIIAHDLKNPFGSLSGFLELLNIKYDKYTDEKRKTMLKYAMSSVDTIEVLLLNLLSWTRSQSGTIQFKPKKTNIVDIIKSNIKLVSNQADQKQIKLTLTTSTPTIMLNLDSDMMNTIMRNLLTNALKFTPEEGNIEIECNDFSKQVLFSIKDSGVGIMKENLKKLFKKGVHYTTHGTNNESGTGLGLITSKDFIEMHNGTITVESIEGKGTSFTVMLPKS